MRMRTTCFCFLFFVGLLAAGQTKTINATIRIAKHPSTSFILGYRMADQQISYDTLTTDEHGAIKISDYTIRPGLYFLFSQPAAFYQELIINETSFVLETDGTYQNLVTIHSEENENFRAFQLNIIDIQHVQRQLYDSLEHVSGEDSLTVRGKLAKLAGEMEESRAATIDKNPRLLVSKILHLLQPVTFERSDDPKDNHKRYRQAFRQKLEFSEPGLLRTPVFKNSVMEYVTKVIPQFPDSISSELDKILARIEGDKESFRYWLSTFIQHYQQSRIMGMESVLIHLLDTYFLSGKATWATPENLQRIQQELKYLRPNQVGKMAPPLMLRDTLDVRVNPLTYNQQYLVLYFYDPDCSHCKKKTPKLWEAYDKLKELNAEVVAVCTSAEVEKWKEYISSNGYEWENLGDPNFQSNFRLDYNIRSTPLVYVLDKERKIIAKQIDVDELVSFISRYSNAFEAGDNEN